MGSSRLSLCCPRVGIIPLHSFINGSVDKAVHGRTTGLCVGFYNLLLPFGNNEINSISIFCLPVVFIFGFPAMVFSFPGCLEIATPLSLCLYYTPHVNRAQDSIIKTVKEAHPRQGASQIAHELYPHFRSPPWMSRMDLDNRITDTV